jgi:hypothetical protein
VNGYCDELQIDWKVHQQDFASGGAFYGAGIADRTI